MQKKNVAKFGPLPTLRNAPICLYTTYYVYVINFQDFNEIMALAEKGDDSVCTLYMNENKLPSKPGEEEDAYDIWPDGMRIFSFGKSNGLDLSMLIMNVLIFFRDLSFHIGRGVGACEWS